jgi:hypothetical protein
MLPGHLSSTLSRFEHTQNGLANFVFLNLPHWVSLNRLDDHDLLWAFVLRQAQLNAVGRQRWNIDC